MMTTHFLEIMQWLLKKVIEGRVFLINSFDITITVI